VSAIFKFVHQLISMLYHRVESSETCLRLFLLAAQVADDAGLEELAYEFYVQAFVIYEESISESRAQLQAITIIIRPRQLRHAHHEGGSARQPAAQKASAGNRRPLGQPPLVAERDPWSQGPEGQRALVASRLERELSPLTRTASPFRSCSGTRSGCSSACKSR
jgi:hypothetical protein